MQGSKKNIAFLVLVCLCANVMASALLYWAAGVNPWKVFAHYYGVGFVLVFVHALGHSKYGGWWRKQHVHHHHIKCYSFKHFLKPAPYVHGLAWHEDGNVWMFAAPAVLGCWLLSSTITQFFALGLYSLLVLLREDFFHQAIHTSPHWLEDYGPFQTLRALHYKHHEGRMDCNFGFTDMFHDFLLGTLAMESIQFHINEVGV